MSSSDEGAMPRTDAAHAPVYQLTLSEEQAQAVAQVLELVGGCLKHSPRKHTQSVYDNLRNAGVCGDAGELVFNHESLWFEAYKS